MHATRVGMQTDSGHGRVTLDSLLRSSMDLDRSGLYYVRPQTEHSVNLPSFFFTSALFIGPIPELCYLSRRILTPDPELPPGETALAFFNQRTHSYAQLCFAGEVVEHIREGNTERVTLRALEEDTYSRDWSRLVELLDDLRKRSEPGAHVDRRLWATPARTNERATVTVYLTSLTERQAQAWPDAGDWLAPWESKTAPIVEDGATLFCVVNMLRTTTRCERTDPRLWGHDVDWLLKAELVCRLYYATPPASKVHSAIMQVMFQCKNIPTRKIDFMEDIPVRHVVDDEE
uniref:Uncharacterized protein n=1 Tax=Mycena chlorophos TaxID=658473 RepID=A0ABQ0LAB3_MYCCL|nr:predicted protein [Mycena chlorophos]